MFARLRSDTPAEAYAPASDTVKDGRTHDQPLIEFRNVSAPSRLIDEASLPPGCLLPVSREIKMKIPAESLPAFETSNDLLKNLNQEDSIG